MSTLQISDGGDPFADVRKVFTENPLAAAPPALRQPVWRVWSLHRHLFPSPLELAGAVGVFVREHGLTEDEAARVLGGLLTPAKMATFRFAADLMTALCADVEAIVGPRRTADELRQSARRTREMLAAVNVAGPPWHAVRDRTGGAA